MLTENDLKQIRNLVDSFLKKHWYFPFAKDLIKTYTVLFPENIEQSYIDKIDDFINNIIFENIKNKNTKWWKILWKILERNTKLRKEFRKLNNENYFEEKKFKELWKQIEKLISKWEDQLTEKLMWAKSIWIQKTSESWYNMVYSIFPLRNKI